MHCILLQSFRQVLFPLFHSPFSFPEAMHLAAPGNKITGNHVPLMDFILFLGVSYNPLILSFHLSVLFSPGTFP